MNETLLNNKTLLLTAHELGFLLGVGKSTIWTWHSSGKIPHPIKIGGCTKWRRDEIKEWIRFGSPGRIKWDGYKKNLGYS